MRPNNRNPTPTKPGLAPASPLPQPLDVIVSSVPKKDWWERFPLAIGISLLALVLSIVPFAYGTWPAREDASVAIVRWVTPFTPDGVLHPQAWLAVANRGNRDIVVLQSPFMYQASRETMAFADDTPLEKQSEPTVIEPGKSAVVRVSTEITSSDVHRAQMVPDQRRSDEKGSKAVVKLAVNVIVAHPSSGGFSSAITNCIRVLMYESDPVKSEVDPSFVHLQRFKPGERKVTSGRYPCLNDSPAPQVTHF